MINEIFVWKMRPIDRKFFSKILVEEMALAIGSSRRGVSVCVCVCVCLISIASQKAAGELPQNERDNEYSV